MGREIQNLLNALNVSRGFEDPIPTHRIRQPRREAVHRLGVNIMKAWKAISGLRALLLLLGLGLMAPHLVAENTSMEPIHSSKVARQQVGNLVMEGIPDIPERIMDQLQRYQSTRSAFLLDWLPDGGILISTRFGESSQLHRVDRPGGARQQITFFDEPVGGGSVSPDPEFGGFLFQRDEGGSEFFQIFAHDLATGTNRQLTHGRFVNARPLWSNRGDRFVFSTTRRNRQDWDIHLMETANLGESKAVLEEGGFWGALDWAPDDSKLLVGRMVSANESYIFILDLESGELKPFDPLPSEVKVSFAGATFSEDGRGVYFSSDHDRENKVLRYHDLESGETRTLTDEIPWDAAGPTVSGDGKYLAFTTNEDGISTLHLHDTATYSPVKLPELPAGQVFGLLFSPDSQHLGLTIISSKSPGDAYSIDLQKGELSRWTYSEVGGLKTEKFVEPQLVRYPTFDEVDGKPRTIPAFYYRPPGDGPFPVAIDIHGGPEGQARPFFDPRTQYLVRELGIAVFKPNVRGSSGYGKSYLKLDNGMLREDSVKDIGTLLDWIEGRKELDSDRVAVMGGSYGGYMVLASMVHYNDRLRAGIDVVGISNFVTFLENTEDYRRDLRRVEYGDERDPEMRAHLEKISPNNHSEKITKPLFVIQGLNDPRVPASESEQMVASIRKNEGEVWYLLANDEGHGFRKRSNRDFADGASILFLEKYLLGKEADVAAAVPSP